MTMINTNQRKAGIVLVVVSAIVFSSAGVFTNGVSTDAWGIIFWRGVAASWNPNELSTMFRDSEGNLVLLTETLSNG
ncbi:hypothetical protein [uncultured Tateyamaria sp.]|uniref:hypothetical protein n=2 Tax=uncultured Tateyamaria sp. TaxID=455651 RepID=UPI00260708DC|nr:hypothetical protein [uncultured Tateyamaria sp.]